MGFYLDSNHHEHGFLYNGTSYTTLDVPLATNTQPSGISGNNIVGGYTDSSLHTHGFVYNGTSYTTLDDPLTTGRTAASGISGNNIVGYYDDGNITRGYLYNGHSFTTLNDPLGADGTIAVGIDGNNIVGQYYDTNGVVHGFLYTPNVSAPEPSTLTLLGIGAVCSLGYGRRLSSCGGRRAGETQNLARFFYRSGIEKGGRVGPTR